MDANALMLFAEVVDAGSFSAVAEQRRQARSIISRRIAKLEDDLGVRLLHRNTRSMGLTADGERVLEHARRLREEALAAGHAAERGRASMTGEVRVTASVHFGRAFVVPAISDLLVEHPELRVQLRLDDRPTDVVGDAFDLAFRIGTPADSSMIGRRLGNVEVVVAASPAYVRRRGEPAAPADLSTHDVLVYGSASVLVTRWTFRDGAQEQQVTVRPRLTVDSGDALLDATLAGAGIALLPRFLAAPLLRRRRLRALLERVQWPAYAPVVALYPARAYQPPKTRAVLDAVAARLQDAEGIGA